MQIYHLSQAHSRSLALTCVVVSHKKESQPSGARAGTE